ncbi:hypothetical protein [Cohnella fermenti]|uniref:IDEAL domain-containing protein n=1 Tax=Cohnella fermenti TaxID=2565925 RepID=A0A4S4BHY4_9BACL|nr:hypothetical protein [Cohnella fermenti]THF74062.1 hypothetical protein E6C55_26595 [Cohnella fermenti]
MTVAIGDWVSGHSSEGELVRGFVEAAHASQSTVDIFVTDSDREAAIGGVVTLRLAAVRKLPAYAADDESGLLNFIDMALMTKDAQWFRELTTALADVRVKHPRSADSKPAPKGRNRLLYRM